MSAAQERWGWLRLTPLWAARVVADAGVAPGQLVVDIGAGTGQLTAPLVLVGARVIAVELHAGRAATLRERFEHDPVTVVRADAADLRLPRRPFRVVANPPFAIGSTIVRRLLAPGSRLEHAHLVLPHRVALRWCAPSAPGAGRWGRDFTVSLGPRLPRSAFSPASPVDCATLVVVRRSACVAGGGRRGAGRVGRR